MQSSKEQRLGGAAMEKAYETVIGLEVHVELATKTKIFCSCSTEFGGAPNTHTCPVCTGMPGSLPVLNKQVVEYAMAVGLATNCDITRSLIERIIFILTIHRTIRFHSYTNQFVLMDMLKSKVMMVRKSRLEFMTFIWKKMQVR